MRVFGRVAAKLGSSFSESVPPLNNQCLFLEIIRFGDICRVLVELVWEHAQMHYVAFDDWQERKSQR